MADRQEILERLAGQAAETLLRSGHCAQSTFAVLDAHFNLGGRQVRKALTPAPGIALRGETCGAALGCLMALGLVYGRDDMEDAQAFRRSLPPAREFCRRFEEANGGLTCDAILESRLGRPFDLARSDDFGAYAAEGGVEACSQVVQQAVRLAAGLILDKEGEDHHPGVMLTV